MNAPKLPSCAPWCLEPHDRPNRPCERNIDHVGAIPAHPLEVEVNVIRDAGRDYVQLLITNLRKSTDPARIHHEVRLPAADAGVIGSTFASLDLRGSMTLGEAMFDATSFLTGQPCRFSWCVINHQHLDSVIGFHRSDQEVIAGLKLAKHLVEKAGNEPDQAWVRIQYMSGGRWVVDDISPDEARDRAEFLDSIAMGEPSAAAMVFRKAAADLGVTL
jgi:hypothetical protein